MSGTKPAQFGVIGLGVMGQNLALNIEDHGQSVAVWNLEPEWVQRFVSANEGKRIVGNVDLAKFVSSLERPRRMLMMIKAGDPVDQMLGRIAPLLDEGDILIDGGNSFFKDTQRREAAMRARGLNFFGMGVSGGEEGARNGPSLMPGGDEGAYKHVQQTLESIAAKTSSGPCVTYVGADGAGHFVKMVHNGIEYGDMQLIAEAYDLLRRALGLSARGVARVFADWNRGPLASYLIEISAAILTAIDPETHKPLVDVILDKAGQKGTGKWTAQIALDLGVPIPTISAALDGRSLSSMKDERLIASAQYRRSPAGYSGDRAELIAAIGGALYASKICSYAQGMSLIAAGAREWNWKINLREIARIWKGGCIIRALLLDPIMQAFERQPALTNLLLDADLKARINAAIPAWREVVSLAALLGIPAPAFSASLAYFDAYTAAQLPQNLTQAQRDFFGAHTYQRADRPEAGFVHSDWNSLIDRSLL
ncbi:MAG: phosphogluconate dehydrogenase (NADP(+)-dependent, decarboxylating) [Acidobacteria bacterium]|nr:MAG: phosphogluconate dehydrogenase (NADP(+)-dependent, decarboxylating) [Acidobacteriota bacterium]